MSRAVVTGASGFIGRNVTRRLIKDGWQVEGVDIMPSEMTQGNTINALDWFALRRHVKVDLMVHCAAFVGGRIGIEQRAAHIAAYDTHLDAAMFDWAMSARPGRVVYWSSSAIYPKALQDSAIERTLIEGHVNLRDSNAPETSYGEVKLTGERLATWVRGDGIPITVLRPFSGYGTDQGTDYPFAAFIERAKLRLDPFEVWGSGAQVRDFVHVDDVVEMMMRCVENEVDGPVNVCTGTGTSFAELADMVCREAGYSPKIRFRTDKPAGVRYRVGNPVKMSNVYTPTVTLEEGIRRALKES